MFDRIKRIFKFLDRIINSSRTPEEYLLNGGLYPSIIRSKAFLSNYKLNSIITAQLYDSAENLYYHNNDISMVLDIQITPTIANELSFLINFGFPQNAFVNFFLKHSNGESHILMSVSITTTSRNLKINKKILLSIREKIISWFNDHDHSCTIVKPKHLLNFYNKVLALEDIDSYDKEKFIFDQVKDCESKDIDNDGTISFNGVLHNVFYTKQYPNLGEDSTNPFIVFIEDIKNTKLEFYYSITITPDVNKENHRFYTTFVLIEDDASNNVKAVEDFIKYFRYQLNWYIYPNKSFSLAQFINSLPLQHTKSIDEKFINSSINQYFPTHKLAEILPIGELDESRTN